MSNGSDFRQGRVFMPQTKYIYTSTPLSAWLFADNVLRLSSSTRSANKLLFKTTWNPWSLHCVKLWLHNILQALQCTDLKNGRVICINRNYITLVLDKIEGYKRNWIKRVNRMSPNRLPRIPKNFTPKGRRTCGKPWKDFTISETGTGRKVAQIHDRFMMMMNIIITGGVNS